MSTTSIGPSTGPRWSSTPAPLDTRADATMLRLHDGVHLATDVYLPESGRRDLPTVLVRLPYDKCGRYTFMPAVAAYLNAHGFAVVVQDVRGKFRSEGERFPFVNEAADGHQTIDWIVAQPWSDGTVGMLGDSYYGFTQWAAVSGGHPALRAIVPRVTGSRFMDMFSPGVVPKLPLYEWVLHTFTSSGMLDGAVLPARPLAGLDSLPEYAAHMATLLDDLVRACGDGTLLRRSFPAGPPAPAMKLPALHMGGWWDNLQRSQLDDWRWTGSSPAAAHQFLRMNATDHEDLELREDGVPVDDHEIDDDALVRYLPRMLDDPIRFLDHYLSGRPGRWRAPRIRYRVANSGWQIADRWPVGDVDLTELHLTEGGRALSGADGGALRTRAEGTGASVSWTHDPLNPVPYLVDVEWSQLSGLPDEQVVHARDDVATFTGEAQDTPFDIVGPVEVALTVDSDASSTHVIVRLLDVYPSGRARMVLEGAEIASTVAGPVRVRVRLGDTAYRIRPGHRLRLAISSSCFPLYLVHPGNDEDPWRASSSRAARQTLHLGGSDGAVLRLPIRGRFG
ncbi:CocE/NonD family hydrolase [Microtetraspora malaysiensis]|uniref:CocE/NonD family hydrolase n=1 Tax=Microtetraspora malaysiensis TaxID=161358 RepID=UPI003D8F96E5